MHPNNCSMKLSWMIETWMKSHLVSDTNYNIVNLWCPKTLRGRTNDVRIAFSVGDTTYAVPISIEQNKQSW